MRADEVVEEGEHGNEVVGDVIVEALHADVPHPMQRLDRHPVSGVAVADNGPGLAQRLHSLQDRKDLRTVPAWTETEAKDEPGFAVQNEPEIVFLALDLDYSLIGVSLV